MELLGQRLETFLKAAPFPVTPAEETDRHCPIAIIYWVFSFFKIWTKFNTESENPYAGSILVSFRSRTKSALFIKKKHSRYSAKASLTSTGWAEPPKTAGKERGPEGGKEVELGAHHQWVWGLQPVWPCFPKGSTVVLGPGIPQPLYDPQVNTELSSLSEAPILYPGSQHKSPDLHFSQLPTLSALWLSLKYFSEILSRAF